MRGENKKQKEVRYRGEREEKKTEQEEEEKKKQALIRGGLDQEY